MTLALNMVIAATCRSTWMPACGYPLHRDDVSDDINAVIIDSVLNGSDVYGSDRGLA